MENAAIDTMKINHFWTHTYSDIYKYQPITLEMIVCHLSKGTNSENGFE